MDTEYKEAPEQPTLPTTKSDWVVPFLDRLRMHGIVSKAALEVGIHRDTAYHRRSIDPWFADEWRKSIERGMDMLEDEAMRRAYNGSDTLLIFMLKANRPKYRETLRHITVNFDPERLDQMSDDELDHLDNQLKAIDRR